jgi:hypothetical protein
MCINIFVKVLYCCQEFCHDECRLFCFYGVNGVVGLDNAANLSSAYRLEHRLAGKISFQTFLSRRSLMSRVTSTLLLSGSLLLGATSVHAALPAEATLYKNPQCGCCDGYARHLEAQGVDVTIIDNVEMGDIKQQAGVPYGLGACHTVEIGEYWIEGHVPMEALSALFEQQPEVDGIGLAGMPIGTPGMPGPQEEPYNVYVFTDQEDTPFMTL